MKARLEQKEQVARLPHSLSGAVQLAVGTCRAKQTRRVGAQFLSLQLNQTKYREWC